jgi:hypothetical protein
MIRVLSKYRLSFTSITDADLNRMTLAEQAQTWSAHGLIIIVHGATEVNNFFLPPHAAVIEISPFLTWCPLYLHAAVAMGHHHFPIYSRIKPPTLTYSWTYTFPEQTEEEFKKMVSDFADRCDDKGLLRASSDAECWHEVLRTSVITPIHLFEHTLLIALETIGLQRPHNHSAIDLLHGVPEGRPPNTVPYGGYENRAWHIVPPSDS